VFYNSARREAAVGEILHQTLGDRLYTIIPFAESGMTVLLFSDVNDDIAYSWIRGRSSPLGNRLSQMSARDYFLDLHTVGSDTADGRLFSVSQLIWQEGGLSQLTLAHDLDAIIWIKTVHAPAFLNNRMWLLFVALTAWHYKAIFILGAAALVGYSVWRVLKRRRRRRAKLANA
jgi:hypothetical protein